MLHIGKHNHRFHGVWYQSKHTNKKYRHMHIPPHENNALTHVSTPMWVHVCVWFLTVLYLKYIYINMCFHVCCVLIFCVLFACLATVGRNADKRNIVDIVLCAIRIVDTKYHKMSLYGCIREICKQMTFWHMRVVMGCVVQRNTPVLCGCVLVLIELDHQPVTKGLLWSTAVTEAAGPATYPPWHLANSLAQILRAWSQM